MSNPILVQPGPIPGACITSAGELDAMITGSLPVAPNGWVWTSATAPDVVTYPILARWIWVDLTDPAKPIKRCWNSTMSSWDAELPADGSITGAMLADHTIGPIKLDVTGGSPLYVLRINNAGTSVEYTDPQNLFDATHRLPVDHLALSAAGSYVLTSDGTTNTWATKASFFAGVTYAINQIDTTGAADPSVLSFVGGTLGYRTVAASIANDTLPVTKIQHDAALNIPRTNAAGTAVEWATPEQIVTTLLPYVTVGYNTPTASRQPLPAAGSALSFNHGLVTAPLRFGALVFCTTADAGFSVGDMILWENLFDGANDNERYFTVIANSSQVILSRPNVGSGVILVVPKDGSSSAVTLTAANWRCGAWAQTN